VGAPVQPLAPETPATTEALPSAPPQTLLAEPGPAPRAPTERPHAVYEQTWFWAVVVGAVILTTATILILSSRDTDPKQPSTTLGDMRAF
jgi:hypothetical protein